MIKIDFDKVNVGDLVEVPRVQFAPMRHGWNGWLFSEAVVLKRGINPNTWHKVVTVEMRTPGKQGNEYGTMTKTFNADCVFQTKSLERAKAIMSRDGVTTKEGFKEFVEKEEVVGCDWIFFLIDKGFLFSEEGAKSV